MNIIHTIGHSTHSAEKLRELLLSAEVNAVADVRSSPYSRINPQFNRETLQADLRRVRIQYVFLGRELGARSEDRSCYRAGKVQYDRLAKTALFEQGLDRVCRGAETYRIALLCAEKDPLTCHRCILVSRYLIERKFDVQHILADGRFESHSAALQRLVKELHLEQRELFQHRGEINAEAYRLREEQIAYVENEAVAHETSTAWSR
jgi:uncharacterized protein (DUF488 family)